MDRQARFPLRRCGEAAVWFRFMVPRSTRTACWTSWLLLLLLAGGSRPVSAAPRVVALLVPGLRADDLTRPEVPTLRRLMMRGASGWMLCRAARVTDTRLLRPDGRETTASLLLTLGAGARAVAGPEAAALTDPTSSPSARRAALQALQARNARLAYPVPPGALGDTLHAANLRTALLGNADAESPDRTALLLVMDSAGRVDFAGSRPNRNWDDATAPYGFRADTRAILADYDALPSETAFCALVFGDLARADRYAPLCLPALAAAHRAAALRALEGFLAALYSRLQAERARHPLRLFVLAPGPADSTTDRRDRLAPILAWGEGVPQGTLTSASTRWPGLVVNTDFLPTVAAWLRLPPPPGGTGRPMMSVPTLTERYPTPERLRAAHDLLLLTVRQQNVLGGLPTVQMLLVLAGMVALYRRRWPALVPALAIAIVSLPLGMLLLPPIAPDSVWGASALLAVCTLALAGLAWTRACAERSVQPLFYGLCALLLAVILLDLLTGSHLLRQAWMSYSVVEGARFYGIGNEYMGAVIGAGCALLGSKAWGAGRWALGGMLLLALLLVMGAPQFGAKVGAIPSAGVGFGAALLTLWRGRVRFRELLAILLALALLLGGFALWDVRFHAGTQSHLARAVSGAGGGSLLAIAVRKLALEGYLLLHSPWSATLAVSAFGLWRLMRATPAVSVSPVEKAVLAGLIAGAATSLLCNDSGVTAAALIFLYGWAWASVEGVGCGV